MSSSRDIEHTVWGTVFCAGCKERQDEIERLRAALKEIIRIYEHGSAGSDDLAMMRTAKEALSAE